MYLSLNLHSSGNNGWEDVWNRKEEVKKGEQKYKDVKQLHFCDRYPFGVVSCARSHDPPRVRPHEHIHTLIMYNVYYYDNIIINITIVFNRIVGGRGIYTNAYIEHTHTHTHTHKRCSPFRLGLLFWFTVNDFPLWIDIKLLRFDFPKDVWHYHHTQYFNWKNLVRRCRSVKTRACLNN